MLRKSVLTFLVLGLNLSFLNSAQALDIDVDIQTMNISKTVTRADNGERGPALAVLKNGNLLLGGGPNGGTVFLGDGKKRAVITMGDVIPMNKRLKDSRFAITDIAVLSETTTSAKLLVSYPRLGTNNKCVEVVVDQVDANLKTNKISKKKTWFVSKPCVPISAVQHTAGRFAVIDKNSAYVTIGDLGFSDIKDRNKRGDLGSIFKLSKKSAERISQGHRNPQGIVLFNNQTLIAAEHGPRGGDEINVIESGGDYGWPFVTHGQPYGSGDYVRPSKTGTHEGDIEPIKYWVPSIAPTELVQLPTQGWASWGRALVLGTLAEEVLVFMKMNEKFEITEEVRLDMNDRIRDLEVLSTGALLATTDSGKLITVSNT